MSSAGCQINPIDVNFHLQKSLEIFDKKSADKIWSKKDKGWKCPPSCQLGLRRRSIRLVFRKTVLSTLRTLKKSQLLRNVDGIANSIENKTDTIRVLVWLAHKGISKIIFLDHFSSSFLGQQCWNFTHIPFWLGKQCNGQICHILCDFKSFMRNSATAIF